MCLISIKYGNYEVKKLTETKNNDRLRPRHPWRTGKDYFCALSLKNITSSDIEMRYTGKYSSDRNATEDGYLYLLRIIQPTQKI